MGTARTARPEELVGRFLADLGESAAERAYRDLTFKGELLLSVLRREAVVGPTDLHEASPGKVEEFLECRQVVDQIATDYVAAIEKWREEIEGTFGPLPSPRAH